MSSEIMSCTNGGHVSAKKMQQVKSEPGISGPRSGPTKQAKEVNSDEVSVIPGYTSIEQFTKDGFKLLMAAIKHSNALPNGRDWDFYNISDSFVTIMNDEGCKALRLMNQIMQCNEIDSNIRNKVLDEKTELVIEANDIILEKVANNIDEISGIRKTLPEALVMQSVSAQLPINGSWNRSAATIIVNSALPQSSRRNCVKLVTAKNIIRPQSFFKDKIDNSNQYPWCPKITEKPNNIKPLAIYLEEYEDRHEYCHPYEYELDRFVPTSKQLFEETPRLPMDLSETPLIEIDKPEKLDELVETLRTCRVFAVDLEHHSYRSFMGFTCLMQISTCHKDYLIDTLALRDKLHVLNEVFTKNNIVKVFHGADMDVEWLQRDLSIYVVNMFDTHQAAKILKYSGLSLAFLMKKFCNILPKKEFQLSDWRIRPLPDEFKTYAREDTHYLIYIYQMMKKELLKKGNNSQHLLKSVFDQSTEVCKKRYFKPMLKEDSHMNIYRKCKKMFDNRQMYALKYIYAWRDNLARVEDESLGYVLPNHMLLQISEAVPREMQGILACCNPIPPLVRSHLLELHQIILKAREQPLEKAIFMEDAVGRNTLPVSKINVDSPLNCPHDLPKSLEFRDDLPTLLNNVNAKLESRLILDAKLTIEKAASYSVFADNASFVKRAAVKKVRGFAYFSPYERYKLVKPFVQAEGIATESKNHEVDEAKSTQDVQALERTDEERIASIRDHFIKLSKKFSEELQAQKEEEERKEKEIRQTLLEMGGSRKRKRDFGDKNDNFQCTTTTNSFHNPTPVLNSNVNQQRKLRNTPKKRKFSPDGFGQQNPQYPPNKKRKKNKHQLHNQQSQSAFDQSRQHQQNKIQQHSRIKNTHKQGPQHSAQRKIMNKTKPTPNFVPYDYASVDFRQFQGGAGSASGAVQIKHGFRPKNRKKTRGKWTKTSAFNAGNVNRKGQEKA